MTTLEAGYQEKGTTSLRFSQFPRAPEDVQKHGFCQFPCVCILQGWMIAGQQPAVAEQFVLRAMPELQFAALFDLARADEVGDESIKGDLAQADHYTQAAQSGDLFIEKWSAVDQFFGQRFVARGSTAGHARDPDVGELHAVIAGGCRGLGCETGLVKDRIEEVS